MAMFESLSKRLEGVFTDLSGKGTTRAAGDDDRRHQDAEFAQNAYPEQINRVNFGAETPELIGTLIGEDDPDQE